MRMETYIRKSLGMKAHRVVSVEEEGEALIARVERVGKRALRCGECGLESKRVDAKRRPERRWRDMAVRGQALVIVYSPYRIWCIRCGRRVERVWWAEKWQRVTHGLVRWVAELARVLDWTNVARHFSLNWKTVASVVEGVVLWGLKHRKWKPLHEIGIDEVSRRRGQKYLTIVYDVERGWIVWIGRDRDQDTMKRFFAWLGRRKRSIRVVCADMWAIYVEAVKRELPQATLVFDRFHLTQHLSRAVDEVRREMWRRMKGPEKAEFKGTRFLWLSNPENLKVEERTRLSGMLALNAPVVKGYLLKEDLRRFWDYRSTRWAEAHLRTWLRRASHSRLEPFVKLARMLRNHLEGVLAWTKIRVTNGALEGMNNKVKVVSHRAYGYRTTWTYIANLYHCCADLPLP